MAESTAEPSLNVTVDPAFSVPPAIVAVNVTGSPTRVADREALSVVVVAIVGCVIVAGTIRQSWPWLAGVIQSPFDAAAGACSVIPEGSLVSSLPVALFNTT